MTEDEKWWQRPDVIRVPGTARSGAEQRFYMAIQPCPHCQSYGYELIKVHSPSPELFYERVACRECGDERVYRFIKLSHAHDESYSSPHFLRLGWPGSTSTVLAPSVFASELLRNEFALREELARGDTERSLARALDAVRCFEELENFLAGGDAITPTDAPRDVEAHRDHPEWFTRAWIDAQRPFWDAQLADAEARREQSRIEHERRKAAQRGTAQGATLSTDAMPPMVHPLTNASFVLHRGWLAKEPGGQRLRAIGTRAAREVIRSQDFRRAELRQTQLTGAQILASRLDEAELVEVEATDAVFDRSTFADTRVSRGVFVRARFDGARLGGVQTRGSDLRDAQLARANLDSASFENCDLRGAFLADADSDVRREVEFVRCDLRGARWRGGTFAMCRFIGCVFGPLETPVTLVEPEIAGTILDGAPVSADELVARWTRHGT